MDTTQLKRIADAMEEILRLVKADQAQSQAQREKDEEENKTQRPAAMVPGGPWPVAGVIPEEHKEIF